MAVVTQSGDDAPPLSAFPEDVQRMVVPHLLEGLRRKKERLQQEAEAKRQGETADAS